VTSTSIAIQYGHSTLADGVSCAATLKNGAGQTVGSPQVTTSGASWRTAQFSSLTASTLYTLLFSCTGFSDTTYGVTTSAPAQQTNNAAATISLRPNTSRLPTAAKVLVEYGLSTGAITDNSTTVACSPSCTVSLSGLTHGVQYQLRHTWLTSGDATISTSKTRYLTTPP
jgi:hypothetical protein